MPEAPKVQGEKGERSHLRAPGITYRTRGPVVGRTRVPKSQSWGREKGRRALRSQVPRSAKLAGVQASSKFDARFSRQHQRFPPALSGLRVEGLFAAQNN